MILTDIGEVLYAPVKAFKRIIENPKYLAAIIIMLLFIGVALAYEATEISKVNVENTSPSVDQHVEPVIPRLCPVQLIILLWIFPSSSPANL